MAFRFMTMFVVLSLILLILGWNFWGGLVMGAVWGIAVGVDWARSR